ncbi:MAG TPA: LacI family DNA-binding transcriptional regulator [Anaerolineae bacterium]|nr:LacI family DNA-binding transcriptional regulator [Anaerolineae bacterium]
MTTIKDVARRAGVSIATVSYVLNGTGAVSEPTRQKVLRAVEQLGYRPSVIAQGLQARASRMIGYSWQPMPPDQFNPILEKFLHGMAEAAARHGYHVLAFPSTSPSDEVAPYREMVETGRVDGFVLSNTNLDDPRIQYLLDADFPFVAFGRSNAGLDFPWVDVDGVDGVEQAVRHLVELGHRRIACLAWPEDSLTGQYRLQGYCRAMADAGLGVEPEWIVRTGNFYQEAHRDARPWFALSLDRRPTAVVALTDLMAMGVMNAVVDAGLAVGGDVAVIGFDDSPVAGYLQPPLTSLRQPLAEVGELVVTMLIDLVRGQALARSQVLLRPRLIVRDSTLRSRLGS